VEDFVEFTARTRERRSIFSHPVFTQCHMHGHHHHHHHHHHQLQVYLARESFVIKTQSEARLESEVLIVHVMVEVVCLQVRLETRKCVALS